MLSERWHADDEMFIGVEEPNMFEPMRGSPIFLKAFQQGHRPAAAGSAWYGQGIDREIVNNHPVLDKSLMSAIFEK